MGHDDGCGHRRATSPKQTWKRITGHHSLTDLDVNRHMYIFAKVVFTGVCLSTGGGVSAPLHTGLHPQADTPLADTPLADTPWADTPWADTPPGQTSPWADTPFSADTPRQTPPGQTPPCPVHAGIHTPPCPVHAGIHTSLSSACWDTHFPVQCLLGYGQQAGTMHPSLLKVQKLRNQSALSRK